MPHLRHALALGTLLAVPLALAFACGGGDSNPFQLQSEQVAAANYASALAFAPDGRLFFAERVSGDIRIVGADGKVLSEPFAHVDAVTWLPDQGTDWGLTGLALDPAFESNHFVYAFYTEAVPSSVDRPIARAKLVRFTEAGNKAAGPPEVLAADFPETRLDHQGFRANGSIHFGPDGALYVSLGDYDYGKTPGDHGVPPAQDRLSPLGKLLRLDPATGGPAAGNPLAGEDADERIFAFGFAQPFNFAFHPQTGNIYGTDNTDSCEELNIVGAGKNYGWPDVGEFPFSDCAFGTQEKAVGFLARRGMQPGQFSSWIETSGLAFVSAARYPSLGDSLLICAAASGQMRRLILAGPNFDQVTSDDEVVDDCTGDLTTSPDGTVYYSNKTEIRRLTPKSQ